MSAFPKMLLTNVGIALQAKVQSGVTLELTRIGLGDGNLNGQPISPLKNLINQTVSVPIMDGKQIINSNTLQVPGFFSNKDVQVGFWWREFGVFANDPDSGEILYAYSNAGNAGDYIPTIADQRIEKLIYASFTVQNAENVNITIPQSDTFIPKKEKGAKDGVATLDETGKIPQDQLPELDFIPNSEKGQPNGVPILDEHGKIPADNMPANTPTLGEDGKIPIGQLPTLDFIPNSQKGIAGGVAPLGLDGFLSLAFGGIGAGTATGARTNLEVAKPVRTEVLFPTSGWILSGNTYTQTIACSVAKATMKYANIGAKYSTDAAARELEKEAYALIAYIDTLDGQLKATCWGNEKPQVNLTLIFEGGVN